MNTAIVTGASRGIGRQIALHLAHLGWNVGLLARSEEKLADVASQIRAALAPGSDHPGSDRPGSHRRARVAYAAADVGDWKAVRAATEAFREELGAPSLLINNAGAIDREVPVWESHPDQLETVVRTNLLGTLLVERAVLPSFVERGGGRVINLVSGAGARSWHIMPAYTSTKAALIRNVGDLAAAGEDEGIFAFALAPGVVRTDMTEAMQTHRGRASFTPVERTLELVEAIALGRLDAWSGAYLRADTDEVDELLARGPVRAPAHRSFGILPWGEDDPLA